MPPVASDFWDVVEEFLDERVNDIGSRRALAARLHALDQRQTQESWLRSLKRYAGTSVPKEETAALIAQAFGVTRDRLPPVERLSLQSLDHRSRLLEVKVAAMEDVFGSRLRELGAQVEAAATKADLRSGLESLREAIDVAARTDTRRSPRRKEAK